MRAAQLSYRDFAMDDALNQLRRELGGRYEVEQELGHGGMAVVYLAKDLRHDRKVAIKVLRQDVGGASAERFLREIRTVAQLHHPHILQLIDSGTAANHLFYVMPYVEGETVRQRLEREGPLPIDEAVRIAREVADALAFAHARGIVHRDIKPENIFLSAGHALVADFGIARAAESAAGNTTLTDAGLAVGTPAYMSPEQATAEPRLDGRSDQYALGCVLYEMLAGAPPFTGPTSQAIMARHTADPVPPLRTVRDVPVALESAINRTLAKMPADRFQSLTSFIDALEVPRQLTSSAAPATTPPRTRYWVAAATVLLLGISLWQTAAPWRAGDDEGSRGSGLVPVAVAPFTFRDSSVSVFADGLRELLLLGLVRVQGLALPDPSNPRLMASRERGDDTREIARTLGARFLVTAEIQIDRDRVRVFPRVTEVASGRVLLSEMLNGELGDTETRDLFRVQDQMAEKVVSAIIPGLAPSVRSNAARGMRTRSREALRLFSEALASPNDLAGNRAAVKLLEHALVADSTFADAWVELSHRILMSGQYSAAQSAARGTELALRWRRAIDKALQIDPSHPGALGQRGYYRYSYEWNWDEALKDLRTAAKLSPATDGPYTVLALVFSFSAQTDSALEYARRAMEVAPTSPWSWNILGKVYAFAGMRDSAIAASERSLALDSTMWHTNWVLANEYLDADRVAESDAALRRMLRFGEDEAWMMAAQYYARAGRRSEARLLADSITTRSRVEYIPPIVRAVVSLAIGDTVRALDALEESLAQRTPVEMPGALTLYFSGLRGQPRFERIRRQVFGDRPMLNGPYR